jgi:hypothetical protein
MGENGAYEWFVANLHKNSPKPIGDGEDTRAINLLGPALFVMAKKLIEVLPKEGVFLTPSLDKILSQVVPDDIWNRQDGSALLEWFHRKVHSEDHEDLMLEIFNLSSVNVKSLTTKTALVMKDTQVEAEERTPDMLFTEDYCVDSLPVNVEEFLNRRDKHARLRNVLWSELLVLLIYRYLVDKFPVVDKTPEELAQIGRDDEVEALRASVASLSVNNDKMARQLSTMELSLQKMTEQFTQFTTALTNNMQQQQSSSTRAVGLDLSKRQSISTKSAGVILRTEDEERASEDEDGSDSESERAVSNAMQRKMAETTSRRMLGKATARDNEGEEGLPEADSMHFLYTDADAPASLSSLSNPSIHFFFDPQVKVGIEMATQMWFKVEKLVTQDQVIRAISSESGLLLFDISGHLYSFKTAKKDRPTTQAVLVNPNSIEMLNEVEACFTSPYLYPVTADHWMANMDRQKSLATRSSHIIFKNEEGVKMSRTMVHQVLCDYTDKFINLLAAHMWDHSLALRNTQGNCHHLTIWSVFLLFHLNLWMNALTHKRLDWLVSKFDSMWFTNYSGNLPAGKAPRLPIIKCVEMCDYRCSGCRQRATCDLVCCTSTCVKVATNTVSGGKKEAAAPVVQSAEYIKFYADYERWKGSDKTKTVVMFQESFNPPKKRPIAAPKAEVVKSPSAKGQLTWDSLALQQNQLKLHELLAL